MNTSRADTVAEDGFFPWPREIPAEWIRRAHPAILMVSALVLYHQFAPLPASPMGYVSELFILSTAFSMLSARGRRRSAQAKGPTAPQAGPQRPAE
ncbi:hypothetical protein [Arthrobacter sp.]|uniref:hypothetical protein n=1 Tax=Arthrobacter sp. TaxID=1667 RepID=UPI00289DDE03|nr:hypothetical protein [Arthrobacter sp.]